jgi:ubiquinone/menaquinone biosynthesis C-methylase UbiE
MDRLLQQTYLAEHQHFWFKGFRRFVRPLLERAAAGRNDLRILDCGCGTGANLEMLDAFGTTTGFDLTRVGLDFARQYGRRRLAQASITHIPFRSAHFDLVTSFDVLYCLDDMQEALAMSEFARVLKPGGSLVLNVAALEVLRGTHSVAAYEVRRYRRTTMRAALSKAGLVVDRLTYTNASLFPLMLAVRTFQRAMGLPTPEEASNQLEIPVAPVNAMFTGALTVESWLLRWVNMPVGSSLLVLAHRARA